MFHVFFLGREVRLGAPIQSERVYKVGIACVPAAKAPQEAVAMKGLCMRILKAAQSPALSHVALMNL